MADSAVPNDAPPVVACDSSKTQVSRAWVQTLAEIISLSDPSAAPHMQTTLTCDNKSGFSALYLPQDVGQMHPRGTRYIKAFAKSNGFKLGVDRRNRQIHSIGERRDRKPPLIALGLSLLLKQTGLPGTARTLSKPHRLAEPEKQIDLGLLIRMAAKSTPDSKQVVVLPNRILINALQDTQPICAHACKLKYSGKTTILSHFDSSYFRAIGYSAGSQYVVHICLAGGPRGNASLWTQTPALTNTDFNFQLFPGRESAEDFGLFYITFYLNLADQPTPWWLKHQNSLNSDEPADTHNSDTKHDNSQLQRKAG